MPESVFSQLEVDGLLAVEKVAPYLAQFYVVPDTRIPGVRAYQIDVRAADPFGAANLKVRLVSNLRVRAFSISLYAQLLGRPTEGVCRYDVHRTPHPDKPRCAWVETIPRGAFHVHRFGEATVQAGNDWDACAVPIDVPDGPFGVRVRWLVGKFVDDLRFRFDDHSKYDDLFRMIDP